MTRQFLVAQGTGKRKSSIADAADPYVRAYKIMEEIQLNVRDLIRSEEYQPRDDWKVLGAAGIARARLGTFIHSSYLNERAAEDYRKEVWLVHEFEYRGRLVILRGRLDGMFETSAGWYVEEVKSTARVPGPDEIDESHREQCGFYCLLLEMTGKQVAGGGVLYISVTDGRIENRDIDFDSKQFRDLLHERLDAILERMEAEARERARRVRAARSLSFPFGSPRPAQALMMRDAASAARSGMRMLCSAPTGTGKTVGALLPMTRRALLSGGKLFFVTSRVSQQQLALETMSNLFPPDGDASAMQLQAKERSCPMPEMRCIQGVCPYLEDFGPRLRESGLVETLTSLGAMSGDVITDAAREAELCPYETSLVLTGRASVIIADFNYVFDPRVRLRRWFDKPRDDLYLVVDEAHNLPDRARDYYSPEIDINEMKAWSRRIAVVAAGEPERLPGLEAPAVREVPARIREVFAILEKEFNKRLEEFEKDHGESDFYVEPAERTVFENIAELMKDMIPDYRLYTALHDENPFAAHREPSSFPGDGRRARDPLLELLFALRDFAYLTVRGGDELAVIWHTEGRLRMACLDAADFLRDDMERFRSVLCMSATLTPFDFYGRLLGLDSHIDLELPSPFESRKRLFLNVTGPDTTFRRRDEYAAEIASTITETIKKRRGNYLAFFSSFSFRDRVVDEMEPGGYRVIMQQPAMPTEMVMKLLRLNRAETLLLCAVHGGVFSEGVDFPDHLALGAFVVGPGLPMVSIEAELRREYFDGRGLDGFEFAYVFPGMNRVIQAGGRVIRKHTDRGFVMLIGRRFGEERFRGRLPAYWREELINADDAPEHVARFWEESDGDVHDRTDSE